MDVEVGYLDTLTSRDPRVDPRPGDVLRGQRNGIEIQREVTSADESIVRVKLPNGRNSAWWLSQWRKWARHAEVVTVAEGEPGRQS